MDVNVNLWTYRMDVDDIIEESLMALVLAACLQWYLNLMISMQSLHNLLIMSDFVHEVLYDSPPIGCQRLIRMQQHVLFRLVYALWERNLLSDPRDISVEKQRVMFIYTISQNVSNFIT